MGAKKGSGKGRSHKKQTSQSAFQQSVLNIQERIANGQPITASQRKKYDKACKKGEVPGLIHYRRN